MRAPRMMGVTLLLFLGTFMGVLRSLMLLGLTLGTIAGCGGGTASGSAAPAAAPQAVLTANSLMFATTTVGKVTAVQLVTLANSGSGSLAIGSIALSDKVNYALTTTCGATLAAGTSCQIGVAFQPQSVGALAGSVALTDNAAGSPQMIALSGTGAAVAPTVTRTLLVEPDQGFTALYALVTGAAKTIDMTMYELVDTTFSGDLVAACQRGVKVRVILDQNLEKSSNTPAYNQLNAVTNCSAVWANPVFQATHQKSFIVDGTQVAIMTLNLTSRYYTTTRDFAVIENDPVDIAAIQATFNQDYVSASYTPTAGTDLIWSPTTAQAALLGVINGATKTLLVENEEMSAANIVSALEAACARGVAVHITLTDTGSYHANFSALEASGCGVHVYPDTATALYIHAKAMVADYGLTTQAVYVGSINFSIASMTENRELGMYLSDQTAAQTLNTTMTNDYAGAPAY